MSLKNRILNPPPAKQQFNIYLPPEIIRAVKYRALDEQLSLSDLMEKVLRNYLQKKRSS